MKTTDIPKLIEDGTWECDFSIVDFVRRIEEDEKDDYYQLNMTPDFQRNHVWTEQQQIAYVEELLKGGCKHAKVFYFNFPLWKTYKKRTGKGYEEFVCVDGLQRYTALKRFVNNEIKVFDTYMKDFEDSFMFERMLMGVKMNINNLQTKADVLKWYLQINAGGTPHTEDEINKVRKMLEEEQ